MNIFLITSEWFKEFVDMDGAHVETVWNYIIKMLPY